MLQKQEILKIKNSLRKTEDRLPFVFEALSDSTRLKIFKILDKEKDLCVTDIANVFGVSVPAVSYQLKIMEVVGLVEKERMGRMTCYKLKNEDPIVKKVKKIIQ